MALLHHVKLTTAEMMKAHSREFANNESKFRRRLTIFNKISLLLHRFNFEQYKNVYSKCDIISTLKSDIVYEVYSTKNQLSWFEQLLQQTIEDIDKTGVLVYKKEFENKTEEKEFERMIDFTMEPFINGYVGYKVYNVFEEKKIIDTIEDTSCLHRPLCCIVLQYITECM